MNDPGKTHSIYDGLTLREVIALHQQAVGEIATLQSGIDNELCDIRLDTEALKAELSQRDAQLSALVAEIRVIADLPGWQAWAKGVLERFDFMAVSHDLAISTVAYEAGQADERAAQQAAYWADGKMPKEPTFSDGETP